MGQTVGPKELKKGNQNEIVAYTCPSWPSCLNFGSSSILQTFWLWRPIRNRPNTYARQLWPIHSCSALKFIQPLQPCPVCTGCPSSTGCSTSSCNYKNCCQYCLQCPTWTYC